MYSFIRETFARHPLCAMLGTLDSVYMKSPPSCCNALEEKSDEKATVRQCCESIHRQGSVEAVSDGGQLSRYGNTEVSFDSQL